MTVYEDYFNFMNENRKDFDLIKKTSEILCFYVKDIIDAMDRIYRLYIRDEEIDSNLEDLFTVGFYYLTDFIQDYNYVLVNSFDNDTKKVKKYENVLFYYLQFQDLQAYLEAEELLTNEKTEVFEDVFLTIDDCINEHKEYTDQVEFYLQSKYNDLCPKGDDFTPTYMIFSELIHLLNELKIN